MENNCPRPRVSLVCPFSESSKTMSTREHPTTKFCTKLFISSENTWNVFAAVMFICEFITAEKSTINATGFIVGVRDGKRSNVLTTVICYCGTFAASLLSFPKKQ